MLECFSEGRGGSRGIVRMLLLIGIDGATPDLVERLTSTGQMPNLRALMRHGVYGHLQSSANLDPCCAWSSLLTGVNPGKHGVWGMQNLMPESYQWHPAHARMLRAPTLPQMLSERGHEAGTVFVPMTFPAREAEWTTVSGWLAPSSDAEGFAHPGRVASMAARKLRDVPLNVRVGPLAAAGRYQEALEQAIEAMRGKAAFIEELLADHRWDMLAVNFVELERMLRWCWHLFDRKHSSFREELYTAHGKIITQMHEEVDAIIGRLMEALEPDDYLLIVSGYGMGLNSRAALCVPELMGYLDLFATRSSAEGLWHDLMSRSARLIDGALETLQGILPAFLADMLPQPLEQEQPSRGESDSWLDYERSWVIPAPGGHLYFHHENEFPHGIVSNGTSDRLSLQISSALQTAIDPATGRRPLDWARDRERVCSGPFMNRLPHLVTRWDHKRVVEGLTATGRDGRVKVARPPAGRNSPGLPAPEGIIIAAGKGLHSGVRIEGARVEDVAATVMYLRGERVPTYFDGQVLRQAFVDAMMSRHPIRTIERDLPRIVDDPARAEAASAVVAAHLRANGYDL